MKRFALIVFIGVFAVLLFNTVGSIAAKAFGFAYILLSFGSFLIYVLAGLLVGMRSGLAWSMLAGAMIGAVDSTVGWYISLKLGPEQPELEDATVPLVILTMIIVSVLAAVFGLFGGLTAKLFKRIT